MPPSCTLLVYFEKPPVSSAAWGHVVAAGLCSPGRTPSWTLSSLAPQPQPFPSTWPEPHIPDSQLRHHSLGQEGQRSGAQRGLWWGGGLSLVGNMEKVGKLGLAPHCQGSAPARPGPASASLACAVSIIRARQQSSLLLGLSARWRSSVVTYTASLRVTSRGP